MSRSISDVLDIEPYTPPLPGDNAVLPPTDSSVKDDADFARNNLRELIKISQEALKEAMIVAINSESPRAYEVIANLIGTSSELNTKLLDAHAQEKKITTSSKNEQVPNQGPTTAIQNNIVFKGTAAELSKMLRELP